MTEPSPVPRFPTSLGTSDADTITLLGQDLAADLMGRVTFGELALWLVTQQRPTPSQVRVFEAVLVALADHGFTPTAIAARLTFTRSTWKSTSRSTATPSTIPRALTPRPEELPWPP